MSIATNMKLTPSQLIACFLLAVKENVNTSEQSGTSRGIDILSANRPLSERLFGTNSPASPLGAGGRNGSVRDFIPHAEGVETKSFHVTLARAKHVCMWGLVIGDFDGS